MPQIYATATHIPSGEVTRTLGPFETLRAAVVEAREAGTYPGAPCPKC